MSKLRLPEKDFFETIEYIEEKQSLRVTVAELAHFDDQNQCLAGMIGDAKADLAEREGLSATRTSEWIANYCQINEDTLKKTILGTIKVTRTFLYKFTVGLKMSLDEANEFFDLCGGPLYEKCMADYICIQALKDKDDISTFISDFEHYTGMNIHMRKRST